MIDITHFFGEHKLENCSHIQSSLACFDVNNAVLLGSKKCGKSSLLFEYACAKAAAGIPVIYICSRKKMESGGVPAAHSRCTSSDGCQDRKNAALQRIGMKYLGSDEEVRYYFNCLHLLKTSPQLIVVDDFSSFFSPVQSGAAGGGQLSVDISYVARYAETLAVMSAAVSSLSSSEDPTKSGTIGKSGTCQLILTDDIDDVTAWRALAPPAPSTPAAGADGSAATGPTTSKLFRKLTLLQRWYPLILFIESASAPDQQQQQPHYQNAQRVVGGGDSAGARHFVLSDGMGAAAPPSARRTGGAVEDSGAHLDPECPLGREGGYVDTAWASLVARYKLDVLVPSPGGGGGEAASSGAAVVSLLSVEVVHHPGEAAASSDSSAAAPDGVAAS